MGEWSSVLRRAARRVVEALLDGPRTQEFVLTTAPRLAGRAP